MENKKREDLMPNTQHLMKKVLQEKFPSLDEGKLDELTFQLMTTVMLGMLIDMPPMQRKGNDGFGR